MPPDVQLSWTVWEQHVWPLPSPSPFNAVNQVPAAGEPGDFVPVDTTLLQEENTAPVYLVAGGAKFFVPSPDELFALGFTWAQVHAVPVGSLDLLSGIPWEGILLREINGAPVYRIQNGAKCWVVNPTVLAKYGGWAAVRIVPDGSLASIPAGPNLTS